MFLSSAEGIKMAARKIRYESRGSRVNGFEDIPRPFLIGVSGGTASGKSTVCTKIMQQLGQDEVDSRQKQVNIITMESFYQPLDEDGRQRARRGQYNFDHPDALDEKLMYQTLKDIKEGKTVQIPMYDYKTHSRVPCTCLNHSTDRCRREDSYQKVYPADVILFEGILVFYFKEIRDLFNMKLFVDTDADTRLSRRVMRDVQERGRDLEQVLYQYTTFVKPAFEEFSLPTKKYADVIIPRGADNIVAIDLIVQHIQEILRPSKNGLNPRTRHNSDSYVGRPH